MNKNLFLAAALSTLTACGGGGQSLPQDELIQPIEQAQATLDIQTLSYGAEPGQFGVLRLPLTAPGPYPVAVILHGGCWMELVATYESTEPIAKLITNAGIATWNIEYRAIDDEDGGWPKTFLDVAAAIDGLKQLAERVPLDLERIIVIGHSAGGHLALWAAGRSALNTESALYRADPLPVKSVISLAGISDLELFYEQNPVCAAPIGELIGVAPDFSRPEALQRLDETSPIRILPTGVQTVLINGANDLTVPMEQSHLYVDAALQAGDNSQYIELPFSGHFDLIAPDSFDWPLILDQIDTVLAE